MMSSWWLTWMLFMLIFVLPPIGYGWGYRGWGPPYPRYVQRRRGSLAPGSADAVPFDHHAWGRGGDLMWMALLVWGLWAVSGLWWR
jgi:hypothetical protein